MSNYLEIKPDKRFKLGNTKKTGNVLRGNPETLDMHTMTVEPGMPTSLKLRPPIIVSSELGKQIKRHLR